MKFRYEDLTVGELTLDYIQDVYRTTSRFPEQEKYGLTSQLRRAAVSIYLNLAEGTARGSRKDFARFLTIALGSLVEVDAAFKIACRLGFMNDKDVIMIRRNTEDLWIKLCALRKSQC